MCDRMQVYNIRKYRVEVTSRGTVSIPCAFKTNQLVLKLHAAFRPVSCQIFFPEERAA
jgi:uncharacterized protein YbcI